MHRALCKPKKLWYLRFGLLPNEVAVFPAALRQTTYEINGKRFCPGPWVLRPTAPEKGGYKLLACLTVPVEEEGMRGEAWEIETSATMEGMSGCVEAKAWALDGRAQFVYDAPLGGEALEYVLV